MRVAVEKTPFLKTLQRMQGIVEKRNTMPILSNILVETVDGRVDVTATDLEVFIRDSAPAEVTEKGSVTVNARKLYEIVKEMPDEKLDISGEKEGRVTVKGRKARFNIMGLPSGEFPIFPAVEESVLKRINGEALREMIVKTAFAVSTDETRFNINGFLFERDDSTTRMVTTDGHRLALVETKDDLGLGEKRSVLLPRKGLMEIKKLLDDGDGEDYLLGVNDKNLVMKRGSTVVNIRLLEGEFPDYRRVIPDNNDRVVKVGRDALLSSLKRVSILSSDRVKGVRFNFSDSRLLLSSSNPDLGDASEEVEIDYGGDDIEIAFNARYLMDMLEVTGRDAVEIKLKDSQSPAVVTPVDSEGYIYIIMPMRL